MPIYEYRCDQCDHELERIQKMSDEPLRDCPACDQPELRRLVSAAGFRLKGGGWYETDFKQGEKRNLADSGNDEPKAAASEDKASKTDTAKSESSKSESSNSRSKKPAKTDSKPASKSA